MQPKIQAMALDGVTVECRESTEKSSTPDGLQLDRLMHPGQFEMICYQLSDNSSFLDSEGKFNWEDIHEVNTAYSNVLYGSYANLEKHKFDKDFMTMETSFNLTKFELWIMSDRCNPNNHCKPDTLDMTDRINGLVGGTNILREGSNCSTQ